jgi:hypothetical protein
MSDSYQITLGLGTPASVPRFIRFGLAYGVSAAIIEGTLYDRPIDLTLPDRDFGSGTLYDRPIDLTLEGR